MAYGVWLESLNRAMQDLGYSRCRKKKALPTTARTRRLRVQMAHDLLRDRPNPNDWVTRPVLFTDETFFRNSQTGIKYITVHQFEDPNAFALLRQQGHGRMFSGSIFGHQKGPAFTWSKAHGKINAEKYINYNLSAYRDFLSPRQCEALKNVPDMGLIQLKPRKIL
jgi:hypothetical protein